MTFEEGNAMQTGMIPLISADSHVEEPPGLWYDELPARIREELPPEMRPTDSASQFALRVGGLRPASICSKQFRCARSSASIRDLQQLLRFS